VLILQLREMGEHGHVSREIFAEVPGASNIRRRPSASASRPSCWRFVSGVSTRRMSWTKWIAWPTASSGQGRRGTSTPQPPI